MQTCVANLAPPIDNPLRCWLKRGKAMLDQDVTDRAFEVRGALAVEGLHRTGKLDDLLIAAVEGARLVLLHTSVTSIG